MPAPRSGPRWWVPGDLDGFLGLGLDNLIQILLIVSLCRGVLGYPDALVFGTILPASGISLVLGNLAYAWQGHRLGQQEGRDDRTALPYGINTVSLFAFVFLVMLPVKLSALGQGLPAADAVRLSWQAGLLAGGVGTAERPFGPQLLLPLQQADVWAAGAFALEQGQILAAMLLAAMLVYVIEQRLLAAALTALAAAGLSWVGLMHAWRFTPADTVLQPDWGSGREWALGYLATAVVFLLGWRRAR